MLYLKNFNKLNDEEYQVFKINYFALHNLRTNFGIFGDQIPFFFENLTTILNFNFKWMFEVFKVFKIAFY